MTEKLASIGLLIAFGFPIVCLIGLTIQIPKYLGLLLLADLIIIPMCGYTLYNIFSSKTNTALSQAGKGEVS